MPGVSRVFIDDGLSVVGEKCCSAPQSPLPIIAGGRAEWNWPLGFGAGEAGLGSWVLGLGSGRLGREVRSKKSRIESDKISGINDLRRAYLRAISIKY